MNNSCKHSFAKTVPNLNLNETSESASLRATVVYNLPLSCCLGKSFFFFVWVSIIFIFLFCKHSVNVTHWFAFKWDFLIRSGCYLFRNKHIVRKACVSCNNLNTANIFHVLSFISLFEKLYLTTAMYHGPWTCYSHREWNQSFFPTRKWIFVCAMCKWQPHKINFYGNLVHEWI